MYSHSVISTLERNRRGGDHLNRIRDFRKAADLTLKQLAARSNVSVSYLSSLEIQGGSVGLDVARRIARALGQSLDEVFPEEEPDCRPQEKLTA